MARRSALLLLCLALFLGGCGDEGGGADEAAPVVVPSATGPEELRDRCMSALPESAPVTGATLTGPDGVLLRAAEFRAEGGDGAALILLHQTGGAGLCGWGRYATLAAAGGVSSVAIDLCGYGDSTCPAELMDDVAMQVGLAVDHARRELGARRVVVAGASMGASQAVRAMADGAPADGWAAISGPSAWDGVRLLDVADRIDDPGLVVFTRSDGDAEYAKARTLAARTGARFLDGGAGHGWDLVTNLAGDRMTRVGRELLALAATP